MPRPHPTPEQAVDFLKSEMRHLDEVGPDGHRHRELNDGIINVRAGIRHLDTERRNHPEMAELIDTLQRGLRNEARHGHTEVARPSEAELDRALAVSQEVRYVPPPAVENISARSNSVVGRSQPLNVPHETYGREPRRHPAVEVGLAICGHLPAPMGPICQVTRQVIR